ncbi:MAG: SIMPL domain-containing protein [Capnocytophaga sp.]|nr:SIMPL domain-containing protein [Capnocytophaga sp.]
MKKIFILFALIAQFTYSQSQKISEIPYFKAQITIDTLVIPDRIYLNIFLMEKDSKNKNTMEEKYNTMINTLKKLNIDVEKQLWVDSFFSNSIKKIIQSKVMKNEIFKLLVYDAESAIKVMDALVENNISNIYISKKEYSKRDEIIELLKVKALKKAKNNADKLMKSVGQSVGKVISLDIYENIQGNNALNATSAGLQIRGIGSIEDNEYIKTEFSPIKISTNLHIVFELK